MDLSIPKKSDVKNQRITAAPLPGRMIFWLAKGMRCPCGHVVPNRPQATDVGFFQICEGCHQDLFFYERES